MTRQGSCGAALVSRHRRFSRHQATSDMVLAWQDARNRDLAPRPQRCREVQCRVVIGPSLASKGHLDEASKARWAEAGGPLE